MKNKIRWNYLPHKRDTAMEEESTINDYRVEAGLTWRELTKKTGIPFSSTRRLIIGEFSPFYEIGKDKGNIKKDVKILMKFFNVEFGDLFPRYVCELEKPFLTNTQLTYISNSTKSLNPEQNIIKKDIWKYIYKITKNCIKNYKKYYYVLRLRCIGFTLAEIGNKLNITRERVRQKEFLIIKKLKNPKYKNQLI